MYTLQDPRELQVANQHQNQLRRNGSAFRAASGVPGRRGLSGNQTVKSAARALEIFELFCYRKTPLSVGEVAGELGYPNSSTSVLIKSLRQLGYLTFDPESRRYEPSIRLSVLGGWVADRLTPGTTLPQLMDELRRRTGETVIVAQQNGCFVRYVEVLQGRTQSRVPIRNGTFLPIARAGLGLVLLSKMGNAEVRLLLRTMNATVGEEQQRMGEAELMAALTLVRRQGYARSHGAVAPERDVVAIELPTAHLSLPLAIGIAGNMGWISAHEQELVRILRELVGRIGARATERAEIC